MIRVEIYDSEKATLFGPFPWRFLKVIKNLSGNKRWKAQNIVEIHAIPNNIRTLQECGEHIEWADHTDTLEQLAKFENLARIPTQTDLGEYRPAHTLRKHQLDTLSISMDREAYAHLHECGLGKTAILIAEAGRLAKLGKLGGLLVLAPKGVHAQWLEEQIPEHIEPDMPWQAYLWRQGKRITFNTDAGKRGLEVLSMNFDAIKTKVGHETAMTFLKRHAGRAMMVLDESHKIKTPSAQRTKIALELGKLATYRRIMTGTLIAKNIEDAWAQFKFLDERILGHRYITSFRHRYCVFGGFSGREVIGQKNVEEFYRLIAPHSFRITKKEAVDLPPKNFAVHEYEMDEATLGIYKQLKNTFMAELSDGTIMDVQSAAVCLLRLQQIVCGYLPSAEDSEAHTIISNGRLSALEDVLEQWQDHSVVIWCRFIADAFRVTEMLGEERVALYRGSTQQREAAKQTFISGERKFFVANPAAGGTGLDGLQRVCSRVIYYSNSFNSVERWQSEDRTDRMGMGEACTYIDLVANRSVDRHILRSLRAKKSISDLTLDQIRQSIMD